MNKRTRNFSKIQNLKNSIGGYQNYCDGYGNNHISGNSYVLGVILSTAKTKKKFSHKGSLNLDFINAFDKAEVANTNSGKINMITVSSFCGPQGLILGYDILRSRNFENYKLKIKEHSGLEIYKIDPLLLATRELIGTIDEPVFPIIPGAHVPCAGRHIEAIGPCKLYSGLAIGISGSDSSRHALLMEDAGFLAGVSKEKIISNLIESVIEVGRNQKTEYKTFFVGVESIDVKNGEVGCALISAPYLLLPQKAITSYDDMISKNLEVWVEKIHKTL